MRMYHIIKIIHFINHSQNYWRNDVYILRYDMNKMIKHYVKKYINVYKIDPCTFLVDKGYMIFLCCMKIW